MSNETLKPNDVCEVVNGCCEFSKRAYLGKECTVVRAFGLELPCRACGAKSGPMFVVSGPAAQPIIAGSVTALPALFLRKKPPKSRDDSAPRDDFAPADPAAWDLTGWHPAKTKETVNG